MIFRHPISRGSNGIGIAVLALACAAAAWGQAQPPAAKPAPAASIGQGVLLDRVVAVVNGDLILESDVDEERRFQAFQPFSNAGNFSREQGIARLVDRALILQQARLQPEDNVSDADVQTQLKVLRKDIPACRQFHCETDAGWKKFVEAQGFTVDELTDRWRERMTVLKFIEMRFRMGIRIAPEQIQDYYAKTLIPQYVAQKATAPQLDTISDRIQEILLQQQVGNLLDEWLKTLKAQGSVRMTKPDQEAP